MDWADKLLAKVRQARVPDHDASPEQRLRNQIEATKEQGRQGANVLERLRELRIEHYKRTGANGG